MRLQVKGRHHEVTDAVRSYAEQKLAKLDRHVDDAEIELELIEERNPSIAEKEVAEAIVRGRGVTYRARVASTDMRASIDELTDKLVRQAAEDRRKHTARRHHPPHDKRDVPVVPVEPTE